MNPTRLVTLAVPVLLGLAAGPAAAAACSEAARAAGWREPVVVAGDRITALDELVEALPPGGVLLVGESHDRYEHHLNQVELVCRLHARGDDLAIGLEMFQRPFQPYLDDFVAGRIDLDTMLERTEYFDRWRYDARLYAPIFELARRESIPLIALNASTELVREVARAGVEGLDADTRALLPEMPPTQPDDYVERLRAVFDQHPAGPHRTFERFVGTQVLWDETMAATAAAHQAAHPGRTLVVLAGNGHVAWGDAISGRIARRTGQIGTTVVNDTPGRDADPRSGDYLLLSEEIALAAPGLMGVRLEGSEDGLLVASVSEGSAAEAAGITSGERIVRLDGAEVSRFAEVKSRLWRMAPGEAITLGVRAQDGATREVALTLR